MAEARIKVKVTAGHIRPDQRAVQEVAKRSPRVLADMMRRGTNVVTEMYLEAPKHTGLLQQTFRVQPGTRTSGAGVTVIAGREGRTDYLGYILDGTIPHVIEAKKTRKNPHLRYIGKGGQVIFRKKVRHPGTAPNDFLTRSIPAARR